MRTLRVIPAAFALAFTGCIIEADDDFEPLPLVGDYDPCVSDECPIDTTCHGVEIDYGDVIVGDAMCTVACGSDLDCVGGGICLGAATGPPLCYQPCIDDLDCPRNWGCVQDTSLATFDPVCMPI
ncbi:MAG: hypothetical protein ACOC1F_03275 [Myxococcota bacterium]